tara:strand:- start:988 stop:1356 length:369 start_codon:yes stop_codon:yes gene_type:complete
MSNEINYGDFDYAEIVIQPLLAGDTYTQAGKTVYSKGRSVTLARFNFQNKSDRSKGMIGGIPDGFADMIAKQQLLHRAVKPLVGKDKTPTATMPFYLNLCRADSDEKVTINPETGDTMEEGI